MRSYFIINKVRVEAYPRRMFFNRRLLVQYTVFPSSVGAKEGGMIETEERARVTTLTISYAL